MNTAFLNVFADWHNDTKFTPYVGGGIGLAFVDSRVDLKFGSQISTEDINGNQFGGGGNSGTYEFNEKKKILAWHLDAGIAYELTENFSVDLSYRYQDYGKSVKLSDKTVLSIGGFDPDDAPVLYYVNGPKELKFDPVHQVVFGFRYTFF